jgi:hypothetical protein
MSDYDLGRLLMLLTMVAIIALVAGGAHLYWILRVRRIERRELPGFSGGSPPAPTVPRALPTGHGASGGAVRASCALYVPPIGPRRAVRGPRTVVRQGRAAPQHPQGPEGSGTVTVYVIT